MEALKGFKTYAACIGIVLVSAAKYFGIIDTAALVSALGVLVPMGGIFMRAGIAKAHAASEAVAEIFGRLEAKYDEDK